MRKKNPSTTSSVSLFAMAALLLGATVPARALTNGLALTPQMGWNDWNSYGCGISENAVTNTAAIMAANGMKAAGYQYVNVDDCWAASTRDSNGVVIANTSKFPRGIKTVADFVHSKGLKFGLYTDHGTNTCSSSNPVGSYGYEYLDAMTYAQFGADYLKNDSCKLPVGDVPYDDYFRMADGLMKSGRPILNSLCPNAAHYEYWSPDVGNSWRTTGDIHGSFSSMLGRIDPNSKSAYLAGPGRWNDPDMLEVGNGEFATNYVAAKTHFIMWCIMAAPLIAGNNVTTMSAQTLQILTNAEAIAVDQDPAGEQGIKVFDGGNPEVWSKPLGYDFTTRAVALLNRDTSNSSIITCYWTNLALQPGTATVRDLWSHTDLGTFTNSFTATIPPYGSMLLKIVATPNAPPPLGTNYLSDLQPIYAYTGFGTLTKDKSIGGNTITLGGVTYSKGIGTHAIGGHEFNLGGICSRFISDIGVDDEVGSNGSMIFQVYADGTKIYDSGIMTGSTATKTVDLDMTGVRRLTIGVTDTGNDVTGNRNSNCHADWANARVFVTNITPQMPHAPTGLAAAAGNQIALTWNNALAAISYNVKRATNDGGPYTTVTNVQLTAFVDANVTVGTNYFYVVSAVSSLGESSNSLQVSAAPCNAPTTPTNITTTVSNSAIVVKWNSVPGATSYAVSRFTRSTPPITIVSGVTATNFTDTNIVGSTVYFYLITASNVCSQSAFSTFAAGGATGPPAAPSGLTATPGDGKITLAWLGTADSFKVKRSLTNGGPYATIASNVLTTGYLDTPLTNGTVYYYVVSGVNALGESANSAQATATPNTNLTGGLVAWLTFDDGTASDSSSYGNHGTLLNGAAVVTDAQRGKVLSLDGVDAYVDLGMNASLDLSDNNQATIAVWVKPAVTKNHNSILTKGEWKDAYSLLIKGDTSPVNLLWTGNDTSVFSGAAVPLNTWTHVTVTINNNLTTFYLNGQVSGAANQNRGNAIDNASVGVSIGREQYSGSLPAGRWFFNGQIDDVRIYERALTLTEIQNIAGIGVGPAPHPHILNFGMVGPGIVMSGTNGVTNGTYYLLTSTNLSLPMSQWTVVATNVFDANGNFSCTNTPPAQQQFYMLQVP